MILEAFEWSLQELERLGPLGTAILLLVMIAFCNRRFRQIHKRFGAYAKEHKELADSFKAFGDVSSRLELASQEERDTIRGSIIRLLDALLSGPLFSFHPEMKRDALIEQRTVARAELERAREDLERRKVPR